MKLIKYFYQWSSDGTVMYVKQVRPSLFLKRPIYRTISVLYTERYDDVLKVASDLVKRLSDD